MVVVADVHAAPRRRQAEELARQSGGRLVPAEDWDERGLVPAHALGAGADTVVLEVPPAVPVTHVIGELADEPERVRVTAVVAVACAHTLHADLASEHSRALVDCLEAATHHALVGTGAEADGGGAASAAGDVTGDAHRILAALRPDALPVGVAAAGTVGPEIDCAGWLRVLNGEWPADRHVPGVGVARYERRRPFHRGRLEELAERWALESAAPGAESHGRRTGLRISGLCRLGTSPRGPTAGTRSAMISSCTRWPRTTWCSARSPATATRPARGSNRSCSASARTWRCSAGAPTRT